MKKKTILNIISVLSAMAFFYFLTLIPVLYELFETIRLNEQKFSFNFQFASICVVGINAGFLMGAIFLSGFVAVIPFLPPDKGTGTGNTGAR